MALSFSPIQKNAIQKCALESLDELGNDADRETADDEDERRRSEQGFQNVFRMAPSSESRMSASTSSKMAE